MGAEILGISFDTPEENRAFAEKFGFPYRLLSDADREVGAAYETLREEGHPYRAVPRRLTYLIDPDGVIARSYAVKDVEVHPDEVLADLRQLAGES